MKRYPTTTVLKFLCLIFLTFAINYSCNKDDDLLKDAVLSEPSAIVNENESDSDTNETGTEEDEDEVVEVEEEPTEEEIEEEITEKVVFEARTTVFAPLHDAHLQSGTGYNQEIVRLEEGRRTSYLMFDLSKIDSIDGRLKETSLEFTIAADGGNGTVSVFKGNSSDWSEENLSEANAPEPETNLGELITRFSVGGTHEVVLDTTNLEPSLFTLVMTHEDGDDLAFASKEHPKRKGPQLVVSYQAPENAEAILSDNEVITLESDTDDVTTEEPNIAQEGGSDENNAEEAPNEETTEEEVVEETTEETSNEDAVQEETNNETTTNNETSDSEVDTSQEEVTTEETLSEEDEEQEIINGEADAPQNEAPRAVASASPSSGNVPLKVTFEGDDSSDDKGIESYVWDFRDGSTSREANPVHTFEKTGTLEVRLTVTDAEGESHTDTVTITVKEEEKKNEAPVAVPKASPTSGEAPLEVQFKGSESTDDDEITKYSWDFKDGSTSKSKNPSHTFEESGTYEVELTVEDQKGLKDSGKVTITVKEIENEAPKAKISASTTEGEAPLQIQFKGDKSTDDNGITEYRWDFKDGSTSKSKNPSHTFDTAGSYKVELIVEDEKGLTDKETITIEVREKQNEAPKAIVSAAPTSGEAPLDVQFKGSDSSDDNQITSFFWDFKDGSTATSSNPSHTFEEAGTYEVKLTVKDDDGVTATKTITIDVDEKTNTSGGNNGNYPSNAVFASSFGYNSSDATNALESALRSGSSYVVVDKQSSDWIVRPLKIFDLRNVTVVFEPGVVLRAKSGAFSSSGSILLQLVRAENVIIEGEGAIFQMNKSEYNSYENRHALSINQGRNVTIRGLTLKDSGGDGIYIAGGNSRNYSEDITIENVVSQNHRRQGMSIISAKDVWVRNSEFKNTSGVKPEAGVALEPNKSNERLVNINFSNCKFSDNDSFGLLISTGKLTSSSTPISVTVKDSEFRNNMKSPSSGVSKTELRLSQGTHANPVNGEVRFERILFNGSRYRVMKSKKSAEAYDVTFRNCKASNVASRQDIPVIELESLSGENTLGGFDFGDFDIEYKTNGPFMLINASSNFRVKNVQGDFIIKHPGDKPLRYTGGYKPSNNSNVNIDYRHID